MQHINIFTKTRWLVTIIALMILSIGTAWGTDYTWTCSSGTFATTATALSGASSNSVLWTASQTGSSQGTGVKGEKCVQLPKNTGLTLSTSNISGSISSITIQTWGSNGNNLTCAVGSSYSNTQSIPTSYSSSGSTLTFTPNASGTITFTWASTDKAFNVRKINITYTSASCTAPPTIGAGSLNGSFSLTSVGVSCASSSAGTNCAITEYGWVWSDGTSNTNPTIGGTGVTNSPKTTGAPSGSGGSFSGTLSGTFQVGHTYYYKAYVTNGKPATTYSTVQSFTPRQITFHKNDGTSTTSTQIVKNGVATNLTANSFSRTGYTFNGWNTQADGKGTDKANQASVTVSGDNLDLYAKWTKNSYTLTWNLNGGTVSVAGTGAAVNATGSPSSSVPYGDAITAPTVVKTGYTQNGWNTTPASTMPAASTTYTAQWTANKYDITYKDQGGGDFTGTQSTPPTQHTYGTATTLKIPTKTGYTFGGWFTASDCGSGAVGSTTSASLAATGYTAAITLYAKWTKNSYTLTWNLNGGTVTVAGTGAAVNATGTPNSSVPYNDEITAPTVTKYGYNFTSWNGAPASTMPAANTTYTAQWTAKSFTVTWMVNGVAYTTGDPSNSVNFDSHVAKLPTAPTPPCGNKFMGWTTVENVKQNNDTGLGLFTTAAGAPTIMVEGNVTYYAVFADYAE